MSAQACRPRVVAGYDGSAESEAGLDWAIAAAVETHVPLRVVVVADTHDPGREQAGIPFGEAEVARELAEKKLAAADLSDAAVSARAGRAGQALCEYASVEDLVVVGSRGHGAVGGALIGSVSHHLVRHAPCPVVVARPVEARTAQQIVVGVDGSPGSALALEWAARHAKAVGATLVALHGFRPGQTGGPFGSEISEEYTRHLDQAERRLRGWVGDASLAHPTAIKTEAVGLPAKKLLVDVSRRSSLLVVGARGHDGVAGVLIGSVADHVVAHAHCPVVVVR